MSNTQLKKFASVKPAEIEWRNGLPFSLEFDDVYFSIYGAVEESTHVFIEGNQLTNDWNSNPEKDFTIAELGFGSGLNFLNSVFHWLAHQSKMQHTSTKINSQHLHYVAIEKRPFTKDDLIRSCKLWPQFNSISEQLILYYPSQTYGRHHIVFKDWNVTLTLIWMPLDHAFNDLIQESQTQENKTRIDHWFLDGFTPQKNTSMWKKENANHIALLSKFGTRLSTYSVAGMVKRPLIDAGFEITKQKGFAKKREMLTAIFSGTTNYKTKPKFINIKHEYPWFNITKSKNTIKKQQRVAIIGAGIAGCSMSYTLSSKNYICDIYDSNKKISQGASGAAAGIFHPQITNDINMSSQLNWLAYLTLLRFLLSLSSKEREKIVINEGVHRFLDNKKSKQQLINLAKQINIENWICSTNKIISNERSVYFPHAAVIDIPALCKLYLEKSLNPSGCIYTNSKIDSIIRIENGWQLISKENQNNYDQVIYCGGAKSKLLPDLNINSTKQTRGQTCQFEFPLLKVKLKQTITEKIYLVPINQSQQFQFGATFDSFEDNNLNRNSQNAILKQSEKLLKELSLPTLTEKQIADMPLNGTVGYRLHSKDRLPIVGACIDEKKFIKSFKGIGQKRILRETMTHYNQPGLWVNTAYGSHGLLYSLLASQHLTSLISNTISPLEFKIGNVFHPARFLIKQLIRQLH